MSAALDSPHDLSARKVAESSEEEDSHRLQCQELLKRAGSHYFYDVQHNDRILRARNINIYDASEEVVAGLTQIGWYRISDLYRWLRIIITTEEPFLLRQDQSHDCRTFDEQDDNVIESGKYWIVSGTGKRLTASASFTPDDKINRLTFPGEWDPQTETDEDFRRQVMGRDGRCCCMYATIPPNDWDNPGIGVIDIFSQAHFLASDLPSKLGLGTSRKEALEFLRSVQNGLSMETMAMIYFEDYDLAIDVDDGYRIVQLSPNPDLNFGPDWRLYIDYSRPAHERPSSILLREHFRQSLMKHVFGATKEPRTGPVWAVHIEEPEERELDEEENSWYWFQRLLRDRDESIDLGEKIWLSSLGKDAFEQYLQKSLFGCLPEFLDGDHSEADERYARFNKQRLEELSEIEDLEDVEDIEWPEFPENTSPSVVIFGAELRACA